MSFILAVSILIRLAALAWSLVLLRRGEPDKAIGHYKKAWSTDHPTRPASRPLDIPRKSGHAVLGPLEILRGSAPAVS